MHWHLETATINDIVKFHVELVGKTQSLRDMENCSYLVLGEESHCHAHGHAVDLELILCYSSKMRIANMWGLIWHCSHNAYSPLNVLLTEL